MGIFTKQVEIEKIEKKQYRPEIRSKKINWVIWVILIIVVLAGLLDYPIIWNKSTDWFNQKIGLVNLPHYFNKPFRLGLDLQGGTHLVYQADLSAIDAKEAVSSMEGVRNVIERRVNLFGVAEPVIQINKQGENYRLVVELAGIKDVYQAIEMIGQTPYLDFETEKPKSETDAILARQAPIREKLNQGQELSEDEQKILLEDPYFIPTILTGRYIKKAEMIFDQQTYEPQVNLIFNDEGAKIFEQITKENVGKRLAIYLDGQPISAPVVQSVISGGKAQISGNFTQKEVKLLVERLNAGALPAPINLISQETIGASLGKASLDQSLKAGLIGFILVLVFMIFYYRLPGILASLALVIYVIVVLAIFKLLSITLTLAGIAGFILSIGMAVDANVLIFERFKEEMKLGKSLSISIDEGFRRAWLAIRDGNLTTILTAVILYIFSTGLVRGFALTLSIGVLVSMFSAIIITRTFLKWFVGKKLEKSTKLWG